MNKKKSFIVGGCLVVIAAVLVVMGLMLKTPQIVYDNRVITDDFVRYPYGGSGEYEEEESKANVSNTANALVDVNLYSDNVNNDDLIASDLSSTDSVLSDYVLVTFDTTGKTKISDVETKTIIITVDNKSDLDLGVYFWNKNDTEKLHDGSKDAPNEAQIQIIDNVEVSDILYGHYTFGVNNEFDVEYEFYNHVPAGELETMHININVNKIVSETMNLYLPIKLNVEEYISNEDLLNRYEYNQMPTTFFKAQANGMLLNLFETQVGYNLGYYEDYETVEWASVESPENVPTVTHLVIPYGYESQIEVLNASMDSGTVRGMLKFDALKAVSIPDSLAMDEKLLWLEANNVSSVIIPEGIVMVGRPDYMYSCGYFQDFETDTNKTFVPQDFKATLVLKLTELTSIHIPTSVSTIANYAFTDASKLRNLKIPESVITIGTCAFYGCESIKEINLSTNITTIGDEAFAGTGITSFYLPESVTTIGVYVLAGCNVTQVTLATVPSPTTWRNFTSPFGNMKTNFRAIILDGVTTIGVSAFANCRNLISVTIPSTVTILGDYAFNSCSGLTEITLPEGLTTINRGALIYCDGLTEVVIPNSVTKIANHAIYTCRNLAKVTIGSGVVSIGNSALYGDFALKELHYNGTRSKWNEIMGNENVMKGITIYCTDTEFINR